LNTQVESCPQRQLSDHHRMPQTHFHQSYYKDQSYYKVFIVILTSTCRVHHLAGNFATRHPPPPHADQNDWRRFFSQNIFWIMQNQNP